jgi:uncharacterized protein (DUF58 family)
MDDRQRRHLDEGVRAGQRYALGLPRHAPLGGTGSALNNRTGSSQEFKDHRAYEPGDDLRHIDWNVFARTDQLTVKRFREEVNPHVDVLVDGSCSMALEGSAKEAATLALAAFFATAAANSGFAHALWRLAGEVQPVAHGTALPSAWAGLDFGHRGGPAEALAPAGVGWRPRGIRVLLSDLLWPGDPLRLLRPLADRAAVTLVVQVLARADVHPPEEGGLRLIDAETGQARDLHLDATAARLYREALARHQENWHQACRQAGAVFATVEAEALLRDWRLDELVQSEVLKVV